MDSGVGVYLDAIVSNAINVVSNILLMNHFITFCDQLQIDDHIFFLISSAVYAEVVVTVCIPLITTILIMQYKSSWEVCLKKVL